MEALRLPPRVRFGGRRPSTKSDWRRDRADRQLNPRSQRQKRAVRARRSLDLQTDRKLLDGQPHRHGNGGKTSTACGKRVARKKWRGLVLASDREPSLFRDLRGGATRRRQNKRIGPGERSSVQALEFRTVGRLDRSDGSIRYVTVAH